MINLLVSFSGGRTSAYMTNWLLSNYSLKYNIVTVFANTGEEHPKTLDFVRNCDLRLGFNTVWVEAVVHEKSMVGTTHRIVNYDTACRNGEPFEDVICKYGIPNMSFPHCTRELKQRPIHSFIKNELGWRKYETAIGIRDDELRRVSKNPGPWNLVYPLVHWTNETITKSHVNDWWSNQSFDLEIEEHQGNCKTCWKKSLSKHKLILSETPEFYNFNRRMEQLYHSSGAGSGKRVFFRGNKSTNDLFNLTGLDINNDISYGCPSDTCEPFIEATQ